MNDHKKYIVFGAGEIGRLAIDILGVSNISFFIDNKAFSYACGLQNESGGWYGSYLSEDNEKAENTYFPLSEISWANKYFLDALY